MNERARPEYDPIGLRAGGFFVYPEVTVTEVFRDNIFYTPSDKEEDFITVISPSLRMQSNWNVHSLTFYADADYGRYLINEDESYVDWRTGIDGRLDIERDLNFAGGVSAARLHEPRSSPDQTGAAEPVTYHRYSGDAALTKRFNRLSTRLGGEVDVYRYNDVPASGGGTFNSDDRDRTVSEGSLRLGYEVSPNIEPFVRTSVNDRSYRQSSDDFGTKRDSWGWEAVAGTAFDLGGVTYGEVYVGYLEQRYDSASLDTISGLSFGGNLIWNPTRLTTVTLGAERTVEETTLSGASGGLQTMLKAQVDHELLRNLILSGDARYARLNYNGISREDDTADAGLSLRYLIDRNFELRAGYSFATRNSSVSSADYDTQTLFLGLTAQF
ncbi:MAG: outer membrane beta-barrel protein [Rhodovibrionaceae bacterium]